MSTEDYQVKMEELQRRFEDVKRTIDQMDQLLLKIKHEMKLLQFAITGDFKFDDTPIESLGLTMRVHNSLKRSGLNSIGDVVTVLDQGPDAIKDLHNFGEKSLDELIEVLQDKGYLPRACS